jgi:hypothetical protein
MAGLGPATHDCVGIGKVVGDRAKPGHDTGNEPGHDTKNELGHDTRDRAEERVRP